MSARLFPAFAILCLLSPGEMANLHISNIALYSVDKRRTMSEADLERHAGAGVLMCYSDFGTLERGAAAWLIGAHDLGVLNAHNFVDRKLVPSHSVSDCFFRIAGADDYFDENSLRIGASVDPKALHITDDWALLRLLHPTLDSVKPQPLADASDIKTGPGLTVTMVSPAGHSNSRLSATLETCEIHLIDEPSEGHVRRARHNCNDGYSQLLFLSIETATALPIS